MEVPDRGHTTPRGRATGCTKSESAATAVVKGQRALLRGRAGGGVRVSRTVLLLGIVSLLTDISAEMVATIMPLYLLYPVGLTPLQYGLVDGVYQAGAALVRIAAGFIGDRWHRHKQVAAVGYGISAVCKLALIAVGSAWTALLGVILVDRVGKGIRTAPRDALISLSTPRDQLGTAFGVHRALDATSIVLGPLIAFGLLLLTPTAFDSVFFVSFCFALVGFAVLVLFVQNRSGDVVPMKAVSERRSVSRLRLLSERRFLYLGVAGSLLGVATISDGFVYLGLQRTLDFEPGVFPLLFVATAAMYMILAVPVGRLADRVGGARLSARILPPAARLRLPAALRDRPWRSRALHSPARCLLRGDRRRARRHGERNSASRGSRDGSCHARDCRASADCSPRSCSARSGRRSATKLRSPPSSSFSWSRWQPPRPSSSPSSARGVMRNRHRLLLLAVICVAALITAWRSSFAERLVRSRRRPPCRARDPTRSNHLRLTAQSSSAISTGSGRPSTASQRPRRCGIPQRG